MTQSKRRSNIVLGRRRPTSSTSGHSNSSCSPCWSSALQRRRITTPILLALLLLVALSSSFLLGFSHAALAATNAAANTKSRGGLILPRPRKTRFYHLTQRLFDDADVNHDGTVSLNEVYEMVLKIYIQINRKAPINPPSRQTVLEYFQETDTDHNNQISRDEFTELARLLGQRALVRVVAHRLVTLVGAPLMAEYVMRRLYPVYIEERIPPSFWERLRQIIPNRLHEFIFSTHFARMLLIIAFMMTLGNLVLGAVDNVYDWSVRVGERRKRRKEQRRQQRQQQGNKQ